MRTIRNTQSVAGFRQSSTHILGVTLAALLGVAHGNVSAQSPAGICPTVGQISLTVSDTSGSGPGSAQIKIQAGLPGAAPGTVVLLQGKSSLDALVPWTTIEPLMLQSNSVEWQGVAQRQDSQFYRLQLPEPQIFRIEPSLVSTQGGLIHIVGQCLGTGGVARVRDLVIPPNVLLPGSIYTLSLPPLPEGVYDLEWLEGGQVVATAEKLVTVVGVKPGDIFQRLLEPPEEPPASPMKVRKGGVVTGSININNGNRMAGKKGLNAVNVKLALRTGGDDDDDGDGVGDDDDIFAPPLAAYRSKKVNFYQPHTGELVVSGEDLTIPGRGLDFAWVRTYRSRTGTTTPMGVGWDHSYNIRITLWNDAAGTMDLWDGSGRSDRFFRGTNGVYVRDEFFCEATVTNGAFTVTFPDTGKWEFHPFDGSAMAGKIARIMDRNGNALTLHYDFQGLCEHIVDTLGRTNTIAYTPDGFVSSVTDFSGRVVGYGYMPSGSPTPGVLISVTNPPVVGTPNGNDFPEGKVTRYAYSKGFADEQLNHNLTSITDAKGQTWLQVVYRASLDPLTPAFDTVDYVQRAQYRTKLRRFPQTPSPSNSFAVVKCIVNDAVGNVSEYFYDSQNRCVRQLEYTGRANPDLPTTEAQNRPTSKLRDTDPDFFETRFEWNLDSLCTRVVHPRGNSTEMVYQRAFNQNSSRSNNAKRHDADLRVLRERACCYLDPDDDGDGVPDITERAWRFEYDGRFGIGGRVKVRFPWLSSGSNVDRDWARISWAFGHGPRQSTSDAGTYEGKIERKRAFLNQFDVDLCEDFVKSTTDPRGTVSTATYDDRGNLLHTETTERRSGEVSLGDFRRDPLGRLIAITNAADGNGFRRVDTAEYYDSGPQLGYLHTWTVDATGPTVLITSYEYDPRGNVVRCIDPRTNDWLFTYNSLDQMVLRQTPKRDFGDRMRTTFFYDANDNLVQTDHENRDQAGVLDPVNPLWTSSAEYDVLNRPTLLAHELTHVVQQRYVTNRFFYDGNDNLVLEQLPEAVSGADLNNVVAFRFDERDLLFLEARAPGTALATTNRYDYDGNGNLGKLYVGLNDGSVHQAAVHEYEFDGFDRRVRATDPMGNVDNCAYDANGNLVYHRRDGETNDVAGSTGNRRYHEWRWRYDALDRCVESRAAFFDIFTDVNIGDGASTKTWSYAPNGLLLSETDDNGHVTRYAYDTAHRLSSVTDPRTNVVLFTRDRAGNVTSTTSIDRSDLSPDEQIFTTTFAYDELNRCLSSRDNIGNTTQYAYDSRGNMVSEIDARGNETIRIFDGLNRVTDTTHYVGTKERGITINTSHLEYSNNRLISSTDGNSNTTTYAYDSLDRHGTTTNPDQTTVSLVWSPRSNLSSVTNQNGTVITYTHDLLDRCLRKDIAPGPGVEATTTFETFEYDAMSRVVRASNSLVSYTFLWNSLSDLGGQTQTDAGGSLQLSATFDGVGNRLSLTYPGGRVVQYIYDSLNRVVTVGSAPSGGMFTTHATYGYEGPDRFARIARPNGVNTRINWNGLQNPPNSAGDFGFQQVSRINHAKTGGTPVIDQRVFAYDPTQNKTLRAQTIGFSAGSPTTTNVFAYDRLHRLMRGTRISGSTADYSRTYALDANGNRQQVVQDGSVMLYQMDNALPEPADFQMDQYTVTPFGAEQHDRNGNLIFRDGGTGGTMFHYDYADRLVSVERAVGPAFITVASFTYDALGRRHSKTVYLPNPAAPVTTQFVNDPDDDGDGILEFRQNGAVVATFILPQVDDEVLVAFTAAGKAAYFHGDDLGNVLALTDEAGEVLERYDYDDYGTPSFLDSKGAPLIGSDGQPVTASPLGNPFLFHGMFWDEETALYHDSGLSGVNPMYEPKTGRYLGRGHRDVGGYRSCAGAGESTFADDNPWTVRSAREASSGMSTGRRAKFKAGADLAKTVNQEMASGGGGGSGGTLRAGISTFRSNIRTRGYAGGGDKVEVMFNPREYTTSKVTVRGWDWKYKEEGGRHTPFHNKRTTDVTGEIELEAGREMSGAQSNPMYQDSGISGSNPLYNGKERTYRPGRPVYGNVTLRMGSDMLKTRQDTRKSTMSIIR